MDKKLWKIKEFKELNTNQLYAILKARVTVFVIEQNCPYPELDNADQKATHIWVENEEEILAYCRVFAPGIKHQEASIGRVLTSQEYRRKKLGKELVHLAIETIECKFNTKEIRISAQDYLINFYKEFGFQDTGKKYLEDDIPHTEMLRK